MSRTIEAIVKHTGATSEKKSASATSQTMKAIRIHSFGGPEVLRYEDAPRPQPQAGEVLVRVHAAGVNPIDWKVREGHMKDFWPHKFPLILGWDLSGVVEELGRGVSRFKIGDEVYSLPDPTRNCAYADYIVVLVSLVQPPSEEKAKGLGVRAALLGAQPNGAQLAEIAKIIDSGKLAPVIDRILPLSEARRAHELSQSGHTHGKIALRVRNGDGTFERNSHDRGLKSS